MQLRKALVCLTALGVLGVPVRQARACGPDFPPEYLSAREASLSELPRGAFLLEVGRLVPKPAETFRVVEAFSSEEPAGARTGGGERETALYQAGAQAYHAGKWDEARARFQDVLALPAEERRHFSTFAAYMLGRTAPDDASARSAFAQVRELAAQGFEDALGLAVGSLGEEARTHLEEDDAAAIALYAQQAAHGSASGQTSLLFVARALSRNPERLHEALRSPLGQRLMATYVWTRGHEEVWLGDGETSSPPPLASLLEALSAVPGLAGADRLAATAWGEGRFELAERFAGLESTPLSAWVKAKLALRRGDKTAAEQFLSQAAEGFPQTENWQSYEYDHALRPYAFVEGERTLLALMREDFSQASEHVLKTCSWPDIAYVAERVLRVEEVRRVLATAASRPELSCRPEVFWSEEPAKEPTVEARLRLLLGRRLMRDGRGAEALEYFQGTPWEEASRHYVAELDRARSAWRVVDQAEALFAASQLARRQGFELMGTETAPDWVWMRGDFEGDLFREPDPEEPAPPAPVAPGNLPVLMPAERERVAAHAPPHGNRFHYRATAADLAEKAAGLVPPRSQAYAALLCRASMYTRSREPERSQGFWNTYVKKGALLHEPMVFGEQCPEPDFQRLREAKLSLPHLPRKRTLAAVGGALLAPVAGLVFFVRRRRQGPASTNG